MNKIYHKKINDNWWDSWNIYICYPYIGKWVTEDEWSQPVVNYGVRAPTQLQYSADGVFWNLTVTLFGIGLLINRQKGY